ncbi:MULTISPECIES: PfkB family carbohydrate kinase [Amycolatopsis]|uniref:PfkB family carbohydrate kinase n=1 Tax=Amycolatopsis TaxID=1813 RepID=UPI001E60C20A|nr:MULTISPECIES: PfkB family carbohydrate kinase [Amycolatopsis]
MTPEVVVVGQIARDLVLRVADAPAAGESAAVRSRDEVLGGKGANQAVGVAQLGVPVALLSVVGDDRAGHDLLTHAAADRIDVSHCVVREHARSALIVNVVDDHGQWRYLEDVPEDVLVAEHDVLAAAGLLRDAPSVILQLQQPARTAMTAARLARESGARVVLDGVPADRDLLACADILRADAREAEILTGRPVADVAEGVKAGVMLLAHGLDLAVLEVAGHGNVFVSRAGYEFHPHGDAHVVDTTGAGDALVATLTCALARGQDLRTAARAAVAAAASTTEHAGGRPRLNPGILESRKQS